MKVYFGPALKDMLTELRAQAVNTVRLHVLPHVEGKKLRLQAFVTTFCNNQVYESVLETQVDIADVAPDGLQDFVDHQCEQIRQKVAAELTGMEVRRGILQQ